MKTKGLIICGFPGIGKSTLANSRSDIIDFESTNFNKTNENWYEDYCNCILDLSRQGYTVFCSTHEKVTNFLSTKTKINIIFPDYSLKEEWISRVKTRYEKDPSGKNLRALTFTENYLFEGITSVINNFKDNSNVKLIPIKDINYKLEDILPREEQ